MSAAAFIEPAHFRQFRAKHSASCLALFSAILCADPVNAQPGSGLPIGIGRHRTRGGTFEDPNGAVLDVLATRGSIKRSNVPVLPGAGVRMCLAFLRMTVLSLTVTLERQMVTHAASMRSLVLLPTPVRRKSNLAWARRGTGPNALYRAAPRFALISWAEPRVSRLALRPAFH